MLPGEAIQEIIKAIEAVLAEGKLNQQQMTFVQNLQQNAKRLQETYLLLPEDEVALRRVVLNVAFEFRTPLSPLEGYSTLLLLRPQDFGGDLAASQRKNLEIVKDNTQRIAEWYQALMQDSEDEIAGQFKAAPQACQLSDILQTSEAVLRSKLWSRAIALSVLPSENLPPICAAPYHLSHLIEHIVTVMAFELVEYGKIQISAEQAGTLVNLRIFCTGLTSSNAEIESLFVKEGRHMYRQRFEQHGGRIEFSTEVGIGAAVHLLISIAKN